jgi:hypothetical protein
MASVERLAVVIDQFIREVMLVAGVMPARLRTELAC